jgi:hypothetical protein
MPQFNSNDSLGAQSPGQIADYLTEIGDLDAARPYMAGGIAAQGFGWPAPVWEHTGMVLGFIDAASTGASAFPIQGISQLQGDASLVGRRVKISLDQFYVHKYPGSGEHKILCEFTGRNQVPGGGEELRYALRFTARDESSASLSGVPIFFGVSVGPNGISFEGRCVNVASSTDDTLLGVMDSPAFKSGLGLLTAAQPALKPLAGLAGAAVQAVLSRSKNRQVHTFNLGLDLGSTVTAARLRLGTYIVVQCSDAAGWKWDSCEWNRDAMALLNKATGQQPAYNYMAFGVSAYTPNDPGNP